MASAATLNRVRKYSKTLVPEPWKRLRAYPGFTPFELLLIHLGLKQGVDWVDGYDPDDDSVDLRLDRLSGTWIEFHGSKGGHFAAWYYMDPRRKPIIGMRPWSPRPSRP